jgi:farnesyl diphosphate synthase
MAMVQSRVERALERALPAADHTPQRLHRAMRYAVLGGGKRVRPMLAFAAGELAASPLERLDAVACSPSSSPVRSCTTTAARTTALRRGRRRCTLSSTSDSTFVGDALHRSRSGACGGRFADDPRPLGCCVPGGDGGKARWRGAGDRPRRTARAQLPELEFMHILKTGALIRASVALGARCGKPLARREADQLDRYAKCVGLAFQVVDDVLDAEAPTATLGKTAGKDAAQGKPTYVSLLGVARAKALAQELRRDAHAALEGFGSRAARLRDLADFIVMRDF